MKNKIKIINVISKLAYGGVESVVLNYYSNIDLNYYDVTILTKKNSNEKCVEEFKKKGFKVLMIDDWEKHPFKMYKKILKILKSGNYDILHAHMTQTNFYFLFLANKAGIKIRISHSHLSQDDKTIFSKVKYGIYKHLIIKFATDLLACGYDAGKYLYGKNKFLIFKNAINTEKFLYNSSIRSQYRLKYNLNNNMIIGSVGRLTLQKNQLFLIDIFNEIHKKNANSKLILIGSGSLKEDIISKIKSLSLVNDTIMLENRNDVNCFLQAFDIFLLPSLYEGLPVVGIEAQTADLPCFFSNNIDKSVQIINKVHFISVNKDASYWAECIMKVYLNGEKRKNNKKELINSGYDIKHESQKLDEFYKEKVKGLMKLK